MSPDLHMNERLFDDRDLVELFSDLPHSEDTIVPSHIFTPPTPQDDWEMLFGVYSDTCASASSISDEIGHPPELERHQEDKKGLKHGTGFELPRKAGDATPKGPTAPTGSTGARVIPQNAFPCRYENCIGKDHKPRRFKRKYHRNRHERTVHRDGMHILHRCWVKGCKSTPFTRADNLKDHLKNVHGKKSWSGKYQYVATQDEFSIHYEPEWTGEIDENGLPRGT